MKEHIWRDVKLLDLRSLANEIKRYMIGRTLLFLTGEMGSGKTTFVRAFANDEAGVLSPTYTLIHEHEDFIHADFYRIKHARELLYLELDLYMENKKYFLIEWGRLYEKFLVNLFFLDLHFYNLTIVYNKERETRQFILSSLDKNKLT